MFRSIGFVIVLIAIAQIMSAPFHSFENALSSTFDCVSTAADLAQLQLQKTMR